MDAAVEFMNAEPAVELLFHPSETLVEERAACASEPKKAACGDGDENECENDAGHGPTNARDAVGRRLGAVRKS